MSEDLSYICTVIRKIINIVLIILGVYFGIKLAIFYMPFLIAFVISLIIELIFLFDFDLLCIGDSLKLTAAAFFPYLAFLR